MQRCTKCIIWLKHSVRLWARFSRRRSLEAREWHDRMHKTFWTYWTLFRLSTQMTIFFGVRRRSRATPQIGTLVIKIAVYKRISGDERVDRLQELEALEWTRIAAHRNTELYRLQMSQSYDRLVKERTFKQDNLVLVVRRPIVVAHRT